MTESIFLEIADNVFPGFGFFGSTDPFALNISINRIITHVEISVRAPYHEFLNIEAVEFYSLDGVEFDRSEVVKSVIMSSIYGNFSADDCFQSIVNGSLIHTDKEAEPSVKIYFFTELPIGRLVIRNRSDFYGYRSSFLNCKVESDRTTIHCFENISNTQKLKALQKITRHLVLDIDPTVPNATEYAVTKICTALKFSIQSGGDNLDILTLCKFLPLYNLSPTLTELQVTVCAAIVIKLLADKESFSSEMITPLQTVLSSVKTIKQVEREASRLMSLWSGKKKEVLFSKHSIQVAGMWEKRVRYLEAIDEAVRLFDELGVMIMLCYGSLLGAVREGDFIPHDDDVDFLIYDSSQSQEEALARRDKLMATISERGYETRSFAGGNFHVKFKTEELDFFICWRNAESIMLQMELFTVRPIDHSIVYPPSEIIFFDRKLRTPANPVAFLAERYGKGWMVPDAFHEWPWKLNDTSEAP